MPKILEKKVRKKKVIKLEGYLPCFPGFYNTALSFDNECWELERAWLELLEPEAEHPSKELQKLFDGFDNRSYEKDCAELAVEVVSEKIPEQSGCKISYKSVWSPREYNFRNDQAEIIWTVDMRKFTPWAQGLLRVSYPTEWAEYLKQNCSSYDGFISYYPNYPGAWEDLTDGWSILEDGGSGHNGGAILQRLFEFYLWVTTKSRIGPDERFSDYLCRALQCNVPPVDSYYPKELLEKICL